MSVAGEFCGSPNPIAAAPGNRCRSKVAGLVKPAGALRSEAEQAPPWKTLCEYVIRLSQFQGLIGATLLNARVLVMKPLVLLRSISWVAELFRTRTLSIPVIGQNITE